MQAPRALTYAQALAAATCGSLKLVRATDLDDERRFNSLASTAERVQADGVPVEWSVVSGVDGQTAIRDAEATWQPDLIALATTMSSGLERWLNGSVAEAVVKAARTPVLLVPRDWDRALGARSTARILIALDGSAPAEHAVSVVRQLTSRLPADYVLVRAIHAERDRVGAEDYLRHVASTLESTLDKREVAWRVVVDSPAQAILDSARELDVDAIALSTRGHGDGRLLPFGSTAADVVDRASVPLILIGPSALGDTRTAQIAFGTDVETSDGARAGEVHAIVLDLDQQAFVGILGLGRGVLARDVLVPLEFIDSATERGVQLRLARESVEQLPTFTHREFDTPPATWTDPDLMRLARERLRLGPAQHAFTAGTRVLADDGEMGHISQVDFDPETGRLSAVWVRTDGLLRAPMRVPAAWFDTTDAHGDVHIGGARSYIAAYIGK